MAERNNGVGSETHANTHTHTHFHCIHTKPYLVSLHDNSNYRLVFISLLPSDHLFFYPEVTWHLQANLITKTNKKPVSMKELTVTMVTETEKVPCNLLAKEKLAIAKGNRNREKQTIINVSSIMFWFFILSCAQFIGLLFITYVCLLILSPCLCICYLDY